MSKKFLLEVQFPIGPLSLESYKERDAKGSKVLSSLGKWWGAKPLVLIRAIILGSVFPASDDPLRWSDDLEIFLKCMCLDNSGMWKRKNAPLPAELCWQMAGDTERLALFDDMGKWKRRGLDKKMKDALEKRVFYTLGHTAQREYCCRVEEIDGPSPDSWKEINAYLQTSASSLPELVQELAVRHFGTRLKVGDAFSGLGSIPFEAAELGCDVYASDLNPVAALLTWGALNIVGGSDEFRGKIHTEQKRVYNEVDAWICKHDLEHSQEGWRAEAYLYCVEMVVPEWDGWRIPICPSWVIAPKGKIWVERIPVEAEKRFEFKLVSGGDGWQYAGEGTKQGPDVVCPNALWEIFKKEGSHKNKNRIISYNHLIHTSGGLRHWEKRDFIPRPDDLMQERLYCIRWRLPDLKELVEEEVALRHTGNDDHRLKRINFLLSGLQIFLTEPNSMTLEKLRQHDWILESKEISDIEKEIIRLKEQKDSADYSKVLRAELKERKKARQNREGTLSRVSSLVPRLVYREPRPYDLEVEKRVVKMLDGVFEKWQAAGWIPNWRIEPGEKTNELIRTRGWTHWHQLFTPRQLLMIGEYSRHIGTCESEVRISLLLNLGRVTDSNSKLCHWKISQGGGIGGTIAGFYNQALNTFQNPPNRGLISLEHQFITEHLAVKCAGVKKSQLRDAREIGTSCHLWITDPPYADAVNYEELSEFFLAWYAPHLKAVFPDWHTDSMRSRAVKGNDAPFRIAMADCYRRLTEMMPDDGMQVVMFTSKSTDVWEDLALIMWAAGLQIKQVWSVATETPGGGTRTGNYVQATYNMVLRKRIGGKMGFVDFITPQVNKRVKDVITHMRQSQVEGGLSKCGYTDTDYLLAAQAVAAEVVTSCSGIDGIDLDAELRTPNKERGRSALRILMENAKRTATDFLVPLEMEFAIKKQEDSYSFWRKFTPEEKFLLKGLELEQQKIFKISAFQDLGRAYGVSDYESLMGPVLANNSRTALPEELPRPESIRYVDMPPAERNVVWRYSLTRQIYHSLKLLNEGADTDRAVKHLVDTTDFWNIRTGRMAVVLAYLRVTTESNDHWREYRNHLAALAIGVENWRG